MLQAKRMAQSGSKLSAESLREMGHFLASKREALDAEHVTEGDPARMRRHQLAGKAEQ